jgi:uncharacterized membrane protein
MSDIDEKIRKALSEEDQKLIDEIDDEAGLFDMIAMTFKGKNAWMTWYMWIMGFVVFVVGLMFLEQYSNAEDLKESLSWALAIITCLLIIVILKVIGWFQIMRAEMMREIKRLEMRVMLHMEQTDHKD